MTGPESQPEESGARPAAPPAQKMRKALSHLKRELTEEELAQAGVQKMLVEELEKAEDENVELRGYRERFHSVDKQLGIVSEKQRTRISVEIISGACLAAGAAALGFAPSVWGNPGGWLSVVVGVLLTALGIVAKAIRL